MDPVFIDLGVITIRWYGVMMALGFIAALLNWSYLGRREGKDLTFCSDLLFWVMVSGILGARVAYISANPELFSDSPLDVFRLDQGGLIFYGGFIGSLMAIYLFARVKKVHAVSLYDFAATSVPLSHALGRIGCFLNGCCYGYPADGVPGSRFPVQLVEAALNLGLYAVLFVVHRRRKINGMTAAVYLMIYPAIRLVTELMRGDPRLKYFGISVAKLVSMGLFLSGIVVLILAIRMKVPVAAAVETDAESE